MSKREKAAKTAVRASIVDKMVIITLRSVTELDGDLEVVSINGDEWVVWSWRRSDRGRAS